MSNNVFAISERWVADNNPRACVMRDNLTNMPPSKHPNLPKQVQVQGENSTSLQRSVPNSHPNNARLVKLPELN
jgi:hypothetical protein